MRLEAASRTRGWAHGCCATRSMRRRIRPQRLVGGRRTAAKRSAAVVEGVRPPDVPPAPSRGAMWTVPEMLDTKTQRPHHSNAAQRPAIAAELATKTSVRAASCALWPHLELAGREQRCVHDALTPTRRLQRIAARRPLDFSGSPRGAFGNRNRERFRRLESAHPWRPQRRRNRQRQ